jgi:hypothetical protein
VLLELFREKVMPASASGHLVLVGISLIDVFSCLFAVCANFTISMLAGKENKIANANRIKC